MTRRSLLTLVRMMFSALALGFVYVLLSSLSGSDAQTKNSKSNELRGQLTNLAVGETSLRRLAGQRVWVTRVSLQQKQKLLAMPIALFAEDRACEEDADFCALFAASSKSGIELSFTVAAPPQLPSSSPWIGGYVDPVSGAVFDLFGRSYQLGRVSDEQRLIAVVID